MNALLALGAGIAWYAGAAALEQDHNLARWRRRVVWRSLGRDAR